MSRNEKRIRDALAEIGCKPRSLTWEPIGRAVEMCGPSGGWILNDFDPIGLSTEAAIKFIRECPNAFRRMCQDDDEGEDGTVDETTTEELETWPTDASR